MTPETSTFFHLQGTWHLSGVLETALEILALPSERNSEVLRSRLEGGFITVILVFSSLGALSVLLFVVPESGSQYLDIARVFAVMFAALVVWLSFSWVLVRYTTPYLVEHFWFPTQHVLQVFGKAVFLDEVEEEPLTLTLPVEVTLESDPVPVLRLKVNTALVVSAEGEPIEGVQDDFKPDEGWPEDVAIKLDPLSCAIELSVDPDDPGLLCLEVRDKGDAARCRFALSPEDLGVTADVLQDLPRIERVGLALGFDERRKLLDVLSRVAELQGVRLPIFVSQAVTVR